MNPHAVTASLTSCLLHLRKASTAAATCAGQALSALRGVGGQHCMAAASSLLPPCWFLYECGPALSTLLRGFLGIACSTSCSFFSLQVLRKMIPALPHEADGLILQAADDAYESGTCETLLKWKFADLNSVDFKLDIDMKHKPYPGTPITTRIHFFRTRQHPIDRRVGVACISLLPALESASST
jgi:mRNA capping enzyme, catalytic domain